MEMTGVNVDQRKFWNESKGKSWVELQPNIDELFKPISKKSDRNFRCTAR